MENNERSVVQFEQPSQQYDLEGSTHSLKEGTSQAWRAVAGSFLVYFASFGVINSFGFFQEYYQTTYVTNSAPSLIALIGTLQLSLMYLTSPFTGTLSDAYGPRVSVCVQENT